MIEQHKTSESSINKQTYEEKNKNKKETRRTPLDLLVQGRFAVGGVVVTGEGEIGIRGKEQRLLLDLLKWRKHQTFDPAVGVGPLRRRAHQDAVTISRWGSQESKVRKWEVELRMVEGRGSGRGREDDHGVS